MSFPQSISSSNTVLNYLIPSSEKLHESKKIGKLRKRLEESESKNKKLLKKLSRKKLQLKIQWRRNMHLENSKKDLEGDLEEVKSDFFYLSHEVSSLRISKKELEKAHLRWVEWGQCQVQKNKYQAELISVENQYINYQRNENKKLQKENKKLKNTIKRLEEK